MALHIYAERASGRDLVCVLSFDALEQLAPVFSAFRGKTGVRLSEYDDADLPPNHAALLLELSRSVSGRKLPEVAAFETALRQAIEANSYLFCEGE